MKIFGLRPLSTFDKLENLAKIMSDKTAETAGNRRKYIAPRCEIKNISIEHPLNLPKGKNENVGNLYDRQG